MDFSELKQKTIEGLIDPENFFRELSDNSNGTQREVRSFKPSKKAPIRLYRARVFNINLELPSNISELSYPPSEICGLGRGNNVGEQVFYASAGLPTALVEMKSKIKEGSIVVVSEWRATEEMILQTIGITENVESSSEYEDLIHHIFTYEGDSFYKYSANIAKHLMQGPQLAGIIYPSIEAKNKSHNVALKKDFVDKNLYFVNAVVYRVNKVKPNLQYDVEEIDFAKADQSVLNWKGSKKSWVIRENGGEIKMIANGWTWNGFDSKGNLIDPE